MQASIYKNSYYSYQKTSHSGLHACSVTNQETKAGASSRPTWAHLRKDQNKQSNAPSKSLQQPLGMWARVSLIRSLISDLTATTHCPPGTWFPTLLFLKHIAFLQIVSSFCGEKKMQICSNSKHINPSGQECLRSFLRQHLLYTLLPTDSKTTAPS